MIEFPSIEESKQNLEVLGVRRIYDVNQSDSLTDAEFGRNFSEGVICIGNLREFEQVFINCSNIFFFRNQ